VTASNFPPPHRAAFEKWCRRNRVSPPSAADSDLVNALIGEALLPSGVLSLTAVHFAVTRTTGVYLNRRREPTHAEVIGDYVTNEEILPISNKSHGLEVGACAEAGTPVWSSLTLPHSLGQPEQDDGGASSPG
jgi:hypothetical protein